MADISVSDVKVQHAGVDFTLRASIECYVQIERALSEPYAIVMNRALNSNVPRLTDVSEVFAAFALPHGKHTAAGIRGAMEFAKQAEQLKALRQSIALAVDAALPKTAEGEKTAEGGGNAPADPR